MLVGVLGGPIGMLLGWGAGAATGALYDAERLDTGDERLSRRDLWEPEGETPSGHPTKSSVINIDTGQLSRLANSVNPTARPGARASAGLSPPRCSC